MLQVTGMYRWRKKKAHNSVCKFTWTLTGRGWIQKHLGVSVRLYKPLLAAGTQSASSLASATASAIFNKSASAGSDGSESCSSWVTNNTAVSQQSINVTTLLPVSFRVATFQTTWNSLTFPVAWTGKDYRYTA